MFDDLTLWRGPCPELTAFWPGEEIGIAFFVCDALYGAFYTHLPLELLPKEDKSRIGVRIKLIALGAVVIGKEDKAFFIKALKKHYTCVWFVFSIYRGEGHGIDLVHISSLGLEKPFSKEG